MHKIYPCITADIHLEELGNFEGFTRISEAGYYCVFWWFDIPLGQLFIEKAEDLSQEQFHQKIVEVIEPAISFYCQQQQLDSVNFRAAFFSGDQQLFHLEMEKLFATYHRNEYPPTVNLSIVICTRNRTASLQSCLERLNKQRCLPEEIIVVDNAPSDDSTKEAVARFPSVIYCRESKPGLDIARNTGARLASKRIVAYLDDDVLVHPLWVYRIWEAFQPDKVSAVTGLVIAASLDTEAEQIFEKFWSFNRGFIDQTYTRSYLENNLEEGPQVWDIGAGANMAFRKSVFEAVGYFDPRLDVGAAGCNGDSEFWFRILAHGGTIVYSPRAVVYHTHRSSMRQLKKQLYYYMRGFAAASLIQQDQFKTAGYKKRLFRLLPKSYASTLVNAFPWYAFQNKTLISEIRGTISGILFYFKHKNKSSQ